MHSTPGTLLSKFIEAHCSVMRKGTVFGRCGHDLMYYSRKFEINPLDPKYFTPGFPFRIWRDSGVGYALGRMRPEYSIYGEARTAEDAIAMAGHDGVVVISNELCDMESENSKASKVKARFENISSFKNEGDLITVEAFREGVGCLCFMDEDGFGHAVYDNLVDVSYYVSPSGIKNLPSTVTHILWFNR